MRICTFNAKGGVGRTTTTLNLAGYFAQDPGRRVLVADCDPQGSALAWAALAEETPFTVGRSRSRGFDLELLDLAPRIPDNGVLPEADLYLVPTLLDGVSYVVYLRTVSILDKFGKRYLTIANRSIPGAPNTGPGWPAPSWLAPWSCRSGRPLPATTPRAKQCST